jgi:beta-glucosidase
MASTLLTAPAGLAAAAKANGAAAVAATSQGDRPWMNTALSPDERARLAVEAMTLDEQISLMRTQIGFGLLSLGIPLPDSVPETMRKHTPEGALGSAGFIPAVPRLDLPAIQMTDASLGVGNLGGFLRRGDEATALPSSLALAGSFNTDLARQAGRVVGAEAHAKGFNVQLAGGVNLTREPRNGRNFEYAGEDPLLAGLIIGETIAGIQDEHVVSTSKHYALNSQETGRFVYDARIDEGALRESDLLAFEIAHDRGQPGAVMCAYNRINGVYGCESPFLLKQVLKTEWKYPGWVMSDWGAVHSLTPALDAGLDQESPQDNPHFTTLKAEVEAGRVPASRVAESARRILRSLFAVGAVDSPAAPGGAIDKDAHAAVAEQIALQGMVLLKNEGGVLPLAATAKRIVVIGGFADRGVIAGGGGSSQVMPYGGSFRDTRGREGVAALLTPVYGLDSPLKALQARRPDADIQFDDGSDPARAAALARTADIAIVFATRPEEEGLDAENLLFPHGQDDLIAAVAAANPRTVAVLETGNPTAMPWLSRTAAVLQAWYPGQRGGQAIARLLTGDAAPSGRLPMTFPASVQQLPRPAIPGFDPAMRTPLGLGKPVAPFDLDMNEGSDVGYRWFERTDAKPMFAFGYGLTYTTFDYRRPSFHGGDGLTAEVTLTNTGSRPGVEVAQLYAAPPGRTHRLVGWARVELQPGESRRVTLSADPRLLASWDAAAKDWRRAGGRFDAYIGRSAEQVEGRAQVRIGATADVPRALLGGR